MSSNPLPPKYNNLDNYKIGQAFSHELPMHRDWEDALDCIHLLLYPTRFYVAIATNTQPDGWNTKVLKKGISLARQKRRIPKELEDILAMRMSTFSDLKEKIKLKVVDTGGSNKDIWMFKTPWREFPQGAMVIEVYQQLYRNLVKLSPLYYRAFVILDGKGSPREQNEVMKTIHHVFRSKKYTNRVLEENSGLLRELMDHVRTVVVEPKRREAKVETFNGRLPGGLVIMLQNDFERTIRTITLEEKSRLFSYLEELRLRGEQSWWHKELERKIDRYFRRDTPPRDEGSTS